MLTSYAFRRPFRVCGLDFLFSSRCDVVRTADCSFLLKRCGDLIVALSAKNALQSKHLGRPEVQTQYICVLLAEDPRLREVEYPIEYFLHRILVRISLANQ